MLFLLRGMTLLCKAEQGTTVVIVVWTDVPCQIDGLRYMCQFAMLVVRSQKQQLSCLALNEVRGARANKPDYTTSRL